MADITGKKPSEFSQATIDKLIEVLKIQILEGVDSPEVYFKTNPENYGQVKARLVLLGGSEFDIVLYNENGFASNALNMNTDGENEYSSGKPEDNGLGANADARHVFYISNIEVLRIDHLGRIISKNTPRYNTDSAALGDDCPNDTIYRDITGALKIVSENDPTIVSNKTIFKANLGDSLPIGFYPDEIHIKISGLLTQSVIIPSLGDNYIFSKLYYKWLINDDEDGFTISQSSRQLVSNQFISIANQKRCLLPISSYVTTEQLTLKLTSASLSDFDCVLVFEKTDI